MRDERERRGGDAGRMRGEISDGGEKRRDGRWVREEVEITG